MIILNWNQADFTVDCVKSVLKQLFKDFNIVIVDNGSTDNSVEMLRKEFGKNKKVKIFCNKNNEGYAGGNNVGVENSKSKYVVILNNDTTVEKEWLTELVRGIESSDDVGSVSSNEIRNNVKEDVNYKTTGVAHSLLGYPVRYKYDKPLKETDFDELFPIRGVSFIYRRDLVKMPFDKDYFIYAEDFYLGWILKMKGYRNLLSTKSIVNHYHNLTKKSSKKINKYFIYLGERNKLINVFTFLEIKNIVRLLIPVLLSTILINVFEPRKIPIRVKSYWWLITHIGTLRKKRKNVQVQRKLPDRKVLRYLSYKVYGETFVKNPVFKLLLSLINFFMFIYYKLVGLKTIEM